VNTLKKLFSDYKTTISVLENYQSRIFWQNTTDLQFFNNSKNVVVKIVLPPLNADQLMNKFEKLLGCEIVLATTNKGKAD
jgi:hypothetical protein